MRRPDVLRLSKLTDYGTVVLAHLADLDDDHASAADVAAGTRIAPPTVRKLLKALCKADLVISTRGSRGGYRLAREAARISAADVIDALEGPVSITECSSDHSLCDFESICTVGGAWQRINIAIRRALNDISLADLIRTNTPVPRFNFAGTPVIVESKH
jgi:FeS assembly SUF system regulator